VCAPAPAEDVGLSTFQSSGDLRVTFPPFASDDQSAPMALVSGMGDVNGDGLEDVGLGLDSWEESFGSRVWVTFTPADLPSALAAEQIGWSGLTLIAERGFLNSIAPVGDLDGDGFDDVAIGTRGRIVVVFGRADSATIDLTEIGSAGYVIDNLSSCGGHGFGLAGVGGLSVRHHVTSVGDQNGDGRDDLAICHRGGATIVYTPASPRGAVVDLETLGRGGSRLERQDSLEDGPYIDRLGDVDGDGREELAMVWSDEATGGVHAAGVAIPAAGESRAFASATDAGEGFEITVPDSRLDNGFVVDDRNGDGVRDIALLTHGRDLYRGTELVVGPSSPMGGRRTVIPGAGNGFAAWPGAIPLGDQDADGIGDVASQTVMLLSSGKELLVGSQVDALFSTTLADRNGDGRREVVTVHADPWTHSDAGDRATYVLDLFQSAAMPKVVNVESPAWRVPDLVFAGTVASGWRRGARSLAGRGFVEIFDGDRLVTTQSARVIDATGETTRVEVFVRPDLNLEKGQPYTFRLGFENGRRLVARSAMSEPFTWGTKMTWPTRDSTVEASGVQARTLIMRGSARPDVLRGGPLGDLLRGRGGDDLLIGYAGGDRLFGDAGNDRLDGGAGDDVLRGGSGRDKIRGRSGKDFIIGGSGPDSILAGTGNDSVSADDGRPDRVVCGTGIDEVDADRADRLVGCENVRRA
jgi:Ca2+-binding RTX toxin-like protein